jgi:predicted nucleotide-binding protein (sugar kinase/HSP70/actin superfamily)
MLRAQANGDVQYGNGLKGKKVFVPTMAYGSARAFAAAFRAIGLNAEALPPSNDRTLELGARYTYGDECYPARVTVGDFMKLLERPEVDPARTVLFMPLAASASTRLTCGGSWTTTATGRRQCYRRA